MNRRFSIPAETTLTSATVEGRVVRVGDSVGFKSDYEQCGTITRITRGDFGQVSLHLHSDEGFGGEYLRYQTDTVELASDCWVI